MSIISTIVCTYKRSLLPLPVQLAVSLGTLGYYCNGITDELYITICYIWRGPFFALTLHTSAVYYKELYFNCEMIFKSKGSSENKLRADNCYRDIAGMSMYILPSICGPLEHHQKKIVSELLAFDFSHFPRREPSNGSQNPVCSLW